MPVIKAFKAIRYNKDKTKDISSVVAPPYDVIPPKRQDELYRKDPNNVVRLILNKIEPGDNENNNRYTRAGKFFDKLLADNILKQDDKESLYIYSQKYKYGKTTKEETGFLGLMGLDGLGSKVLPHENTLAAPKEDRLKLMRSVRANLSPIFVLYDDKPHAIMKVLKDFCAKNQPVIDLKADDVQHRVWKMDDPEAIKKVAAAMVKKDIFIADGHHRYEVARMYSKESENAKYMMVYFVESDEKMLTVLAAHRLAKDISGMKAPEIEEKLKIFFRIEKFDSLDKLMRRLQGLAASHAFGMYLGGKTFYILILKNPRQSDAAIKDKPREWKRLDVSILHLFIFQHVLGIRDDDENIEFVKSAEETARLIQSGAFKIAFFLNPTKVSEVKKIAKLGERMPRKATYFYPKPLSGLVINKF